MCRDFVRSFHTKKKKSGRMVLIFIDVLSSEDTLYSTNTNRSLILIEIHNSAFKREE